MSQKMNRARFIWFEIQENAKKCSVHARNNRDRAHLRKLRCKFLRDKGFIIEDELMMSRFVTVVSFLDGIFTAFFLFIGIEITQKKDKIMNHFFTIFLIALDHP